MAESILDFFVQNEMYKSNNLVSRAQKIHDDYGISPASLAEYRSKHGGLGILNALIVGGIAALITGGAVLLFGAAFISGGLAAAAVLTGIGVGLVAGEISALMQSNKVAKGYTQYLDKFVEHAKAERDRSEHGQGHSMDEMMLIQQLMQMAAAEAKQPEKTPSHEPHPAPSSDTPVPPVKHMESMEGIENVEGMEGFGKKKDPKTPPEETTPAHSGDEKKTGSDTPPPASAPAKHLAEGMEPTTNLESAEAAPVVSPAQSAPDAASI